MSKDDKYYVVKELDPFTGEFTIKSVRFVKSLNSFFGKRFSSEEMAKRYAEEMNKKIDLGEIR